MCTALVLLIPADADLQHAQAVAQRHGFVAARGHGFLPERWRGATILDPNESQCDCGTMIGREHRARARAPTWLVHG